MLYFLESILDDISNAIVYTALLFNVSSWAELKRGSNDLNLLKFESLKRLNTLSLLIRSLNTLISQNFSQTEQKMSQTVSFKGQK